jgi:hypothetical protein
MADRELGVVAIRGPGVSGRDDLRPLKATMIWNKNTIISACRICMYVNVFMKEIQTDTGRYR